MLLLVASLGQNLTFEKYSKRGDNCKRRCIFTVVKSLFLLSSRLRWIRFFSSSSQSIQGKSLLFQYALTYFFHPRPVSQFLAYSTCPKDFKYCLEMVVQQAHGEFLLNSEPMNFLTRHHGCCHTTGNNRLKHEC